MDTSKTQASQLPFNEEFSTSSPQAKASQLRTDIAVNENSGENDLLTQQQQFFDWLFIMMIYLTISMLVVYLLFHISLHNHFASFESKFSLSGFLLLIQLILTHVVWKFSLQVVQQRQWKIVNVLLALGIGLGILGQSLLLWL